MLEPRTTLGTVALAGAVISMALLGGVARLFHDAPDSHTHLHWRDWVRYCSASLLAGIILAAITHHYYGVSPMLFAMSGLGGFGAVQLLAFGTEIVKRVVERIAGVDTRKDAPSKDDA